MAGLDLGLSGLASGFDWKSLVEQLADVERTPQKRIASEQSTLQQRNNAYTSIKTQLSILENRVKALQESSLFDSRLSSVSDSKVATASAAAGAPLGTFAFVISQRATASQQRGTADIGKPLSATNDVSELTLSDAGFATPVTAGTFTVNGKQVALETTDTLQQVFDKISTATSGAVTGSYDSGTDKITLSGSGEIILGSATDTSNFLKLAKLHNNGTGTVSSSYQLGAIKSTVTLTAANFATTPNDGGAGQGQFKINGVTIDWKASSDSLANVIDRINKSGAGVVASYDSINDQVTLTNRSTGDVGIALEDVTGNFLAATGLSGGTLTRGNNLQYTVNGGPTLVSESNTITEDSSGIAGLSLTVLEEGSVNVSVNMDTAKIRTAVTDFIDAYNKAQSLIDTETASTTDAKGKVTAGTLSSESDAPEIASTLRSLAYAPISGLSGTLKQLDGLGITTSGQDNKLTLEDPEKLDDALANNLTGIKALFSDSSEGIATKLASYLDKTIGEEGTLITHQDNITKQIASMDTQISDLERVVQSNITSLTERFILMETTQARINQQLQFLQKQSFYSS